MSGTKRNNRFMKCHQHFKSNIFIEVNKVFITNKVNKASNILVLPVPMIIKLPAKHCYFIKLNNITWKFSTQSKQFRTMLNLEPLLNCITLSTLLIIYSRISKDTFNLLYKVSHLLLYQDKNQELTNQRVSYNQNC